MDTSDTKEKSVMYELIFELMVYGKCVDASSL